MSKNSTEFAWCNITVACMGRNLERVIEVEYDIEHEKKHIYGRGSKVKGIQRQNEKPTAKLTIGQSELEAMIRAAQKTNPSAKATDLVFDIQVHYIEVGGAEIVRDRIVGFEATKQPKSMKQGDSDMEVQLEGLAMDIQYNI